MDALVAFHMQHPTPLFRIKYMLLDLTPDALACGVIKFHLWNKTIKERRARNRGDWAVRRVSVDEDQELDVMQSTTPSARLEMMWRLAIDSWAMSGKPFPDYSRSESPGRLIRSDSSQQT
jgi:hypothetical protein